MGTFLAGAVLCGVMAAIIVKLKKEKKQGRALGCGCGSCKCRQYEIKNLTGDKK